MRWDRLFDDIESQLERGLGAEEDDLAAVEERLRVARVGLRDRLVAVRAMQPDSGVRIELSDRTRLDLRLTDVGRDWIAGVVLAEGRERAAVVVPMPAIGSITLRPQDAASPPPTATPDLAARLGLPFVLRDLCRRRTPIQLTVGDGVVHGTIDRVGRDHLDLAVHPPDVPRRASAVTEVRLVSLSAVRLISYAVSRRR
jgi:hypothetical protein